jgi:hypothetical protein
MMEIVFEIGTFTREDSQTQRCISISFLASQKPMLLWLIIECIYSDSLKMKIIQVVVVIRCIVTPADL